MPRAQSHPQYSRSCQGPFDSTRACENCVVFYEIRSSFVKCPGMVGIYFQIHMLSAGLQRPTANLQRSLGAFSDLLSSGYYSVLLGNTTPKADGQLTSSSFLRGRQPAR